MKNNFISRLLLFVVIITLYSCRNNELITEQENENYININSAKLTSKVISLNASKHKEKLISTLADFRSKVSKIQNRAFGKNINYDNITVDTKNVTYIENGPNYHTYTFRIFRDNTSNDGLVENLLLSPLPDGGYKEFLITYNFTEQEKKTILTGGDVNRKGKMNIVELDKGTFGNPLAKSSSCSYQDVDVYIPCADGVHNSSNVSDWGNCIHKGKVGAPVHYSLVALVCVDDPDSPGGISTPPSGGGGGGGGSTGGGTNPPCVTTPTNPGDIGFEDNDGNSCSVGTPTVPVLSSFPIYVKNLPTDLKMLINDSSNIDFYQGLQKFYDFNESQLSKDLIKWSLQFKQNNTVTWDEFQPLFLEVYNFLFDNYADTLNPEQIFIRFEDLKNALAQNPNLLLDIPCSQLPAWQDLANHPIPVSVKNRIFQVNGLTGWFDEAVIQDLDYSKSYTINMDVYPVKITNMPEKSPGVKFTPAEFFDYFRRNINDFTDINHGKFYPVVEPQYGIDDTQLWNSTNPLGSLITIKIPADYGTVICSGFGPQAWIFTTVKSPWDGMHPVSGNRLFGYYVDSSGDMIIYTRGVDRFTRKTHGGFQYAIENLGYTSAQAMWETMQQKVSGFVNGKNGMASVLPGIDYTPNYIFVKDYLKGKKPLSALGCH
ncbi:hypothetical protein [Chryseobacterium sp.]|uniref:hypothetical protein n=1 Tax=Chryseobacterium sp. TaxID=1871047 RepID=UPI0012C2CAFD|nr:hypothetical protein [Chryseobacterium sp.]MPS65332.1 hypothetical protein [Chryseobacterium sp.]